MGENRNALGFTDRQLKVILDFCTVATQEPKIPYGEFHRKHSNYARKQTTIYILNKAYSCSVLSGPFLFCNKGIEVTLVRDHPNSLKLLEEEEKSDTTFAIALCGEWSLLSFKKGASTLECAYTITPSYLTKEKIEGLTFSEKGKLSKDPCPSGWKDLDWKIYELFGYPRDISYTKAGEKLDMHWKTVRKHYCKILKQCKVLSCFFPLGYTGYHYIFLTFRTQYEVGLVRALKKLDRTSYLYKYNDMILLILFLPPDPLSYNKASSRFRQLEEMGLIHKLRVSIPIEWYRPTFNLRD